MKALVQDDDIVARLRALVPARSLTWGEARNLAERQATLLLRLAHIAEPPVPQLVISSLPGVVVDHQPDWPTSGMAVQVSQQWRIVVSAAEPWQRQRFTVAHEFKHVLDDPVIERVHGTVPTCEQEERAERLCDYFAACLLMPRMWVKQDWCGGLQEPRVLAARYGVSYNAAVKRLRELGLIGSATEVARRGRRRSNYAMGGIR